MIELTKSQRLLNCSLWSQRAHCWMVWAILHGVSEQSSNHRRHPYSCTSSRHFSKKNETVDFWTNENRFLIFHFHFALQGRLAANAMLSQLGIIAATYLSIFAVSWLIFSYLLFRSIRSNYKIVAVVFCTVFSVGVDMFLLLIYEIRDIFDENIRVCFAPCCFNHEKQFSVRVCQKSICCCSGGTGNSIYGR